MSEKDLKKFLNKVEELNLLVKLINASSTKRKQLSDCKNHNEVIELTNKWGFNIGKRWGES